METATQPISASLDLEQAIDQFRKTVEPLLEPTQEENCDGTKLKAKEEAILQAGLQLVGQCIALLIYRLVVTESVKLAANLRAQGIAGLNYINQAFKEVTLTLIGGVQVRVPALYKLSRHPGILPRPTPRACGANPNRLPSLRLTRNSSPTPRRICVWSLRRMFLSW